MTSEEGVKIQESLWEETLGIICKVSPNIQSVVDEYLSK